MDTALNSMMDGFINSYIERDKSIEFSNWLANRLQQEMPDLTGGMSDKLSREIIEAVAQYDKTLGDLNKAVESGQSKEGWLSDRVAEAYSDLPFDDTGNKLQQIDNDLNATNAIFMGETESISNHAVPMDDIKAVGWNEYNIKNKALNIGKQAVMAGLGVAANTIKLNMESGEGINSEVIGQALQDGMETAKCEVKAVVAGAIKTAAEKGLTEILPAGTSVETICDVAGVAVESAGALFDVAMGKSTMVEALDKTARASVAAACRWCADILKGELLCIPVVGPIVTMFAGGLLDHMKSPKFAEHMYTLVLDAAHATWEGIKQTGRSILNELANRGTELLHNQNIMRRES